MLPCTVAFVSSTVAAASAMHLQTLQVGARVHSNKALACHSSSSLLLTGLEVRLKKVILVSVILQGTSFSLQRAPTSTVPRAEHVQQLSSRLMFV